MKSRQSGSSLLELLLVIMTVGLMVVLLASIPNSIGLVGKSQHLSIAKEIASREISRERVTGYSNLSNGTFNFQDSRLSMLPGGAARVLVNDCDPSICTSGEQTKQVTVEVNWTDNAKSQSYKIDTLIGNGGLRL